MDRAFLPPEEDCFSATPAFSMSTGFPSPCFPARFALDDAVDGVDRLCSAASAAASTIGPDGEEANSFRAVAPLAPLAPLLDDASDI